MADKPTKIEGIQQVIAELRQLNKSSKKDMIREKEALDRAEKIALGQEEVVASNEGAIDAATDFRRRFIAGQAKTLLEKGKLGQNAEPDKPATRGRQDQLFNEVHKLYEIFVKKAGDDAEALREKDKVGSSAEKKGNFLSMAKNGSIAAAKATKGFFSKLLGKIGGASLSGGGILLAGAGILAGGGGYLLKQLGDLDGKSIRANVNEIMGIADDNADSDLGFLLKGGTFGLAMGAIGAGLLAFTVGATPAVLLSDWTNGTKWSESIANNVGNLLMIAGSDYEANAHILAGSVTLAGALGAISLGLVAFSAASVAGVGATALDKAQAKFSDGTGWSQNIYDNVYTLLSIKDLSGGNLGMLGDSAGFLGAMIGLGAGILAFSAGSATGIITASADQALTAMSGFGFAQNIYDNVATLLSIKDLSGGNWGMLSDSAGFLGAMIGISAGLVAFSVGEASSGVASAIASFSEKGWTKDITDNVKDLMGLTGHKNFTLANVTGFTGALAAMSLGLIAFNATKVLDTFVGLGAGVLNFFTGNDSPVEKIMKISDKADKLKIAADALTKIGFAIGDLNKLKFNADEFQFSKFAADLVQGAEGIDVALNGGTFDTTKGWWKFGGKQTVTNGLADIPQLDFQNASTGIALLQHALQGWDGNTQKTGGGGGTVINSGGNVTNTTLITAPDVVRFGTSVGPMSNLDRAKM